MARVIPDGNIKVHWVPTVSDTSAPTVAELSAGTELTSFITPAGLDTPDSGDEVDISDQSSRRNKSTSGVYGGPIEGEFWLDNVAGGAGAGNTAWDTLVRDTEGYLFIAPWGGTGTDGALIATDKVEVWTVRVSNRSRARMGRNEAYRFTATLATTADPVYDATVTA